MSATIEMNGVTHDAAPATGDESSAAAAKPTAPASGAGARRLLVSDQSAPVTPLDMRQARFASAISGFNKTEVKDFLLEASESYDDTCRENERLRREIERLQASLKQYQNLETSMNAVLANAQRAADDLRAGAAKDAARLIHEAEGRAELVRLAAQARVDDMQREVDALRLRRREAEGSLESLVAAISSTLEFVREQREPRAPIATA
jgi:cell division initiation protein